jgi:CheY-like chemotaxis protein
MSNAVKFTPKGGTVAVRLTRTHSHVEISVADTGMGIPRAFLPYIFERFRQADASTTREWGGLGLGLGIARQLVEMHGGTIRADSAGPGKGAIFTIELPLMVAEARADGRRTLESARPLIEIPDLRGVRVLAIDDDADALALIQEALEATGAEVHLASSAAEGLDVLRSVRPDVLVSDLAMPRMDGFELIARIRESGGEQAAIPAAALTAYARSEDRGRALRSGFQLHLAKPIDPRELMAAIAALAHRAPAER